MTIKYKRSPIFYMGNKYKLLKDLIPLFPDSCDLFMDLFGGSGCVSMNYKGTQRTIYNELNTNIVELIKMLVNNEPRELDEYWKEQIGKYKLQPIKDRKYFENEEEYQKHLELTKGYYDFRTFYNNSKNRDYRDLYLLACYSINHLIRFNSNSDFNASCGNLQQYNEGIFKQICDMHESFKNVEIVNGDAFDFDFSILTRNSFVYVDCPYSGTEAIYNGKQAFGGWTVESDYKLFSLLEKLSRERIKWGLSNVFVNRGKTNQHLIDWCEKNNWNVYHLDRNYNPFSRGNSNNDEVYICNYIKENKTKQISMF